MKIDLAIRSSEFTRPITQLPNVISKNSPPRKRAVIPECLCRQPRVKRGFPTEAFGNDGLLSRRHVFEIGLPNHPIPYLPNLHQGLLSPCPLSRATLFSRSK